MRARGHGIAQQCNFYAGMQVNGLSGCDAHPSSHTFWVEAYTSRKAGAAVAVSHNVSLILDSKTFGQLSFTLGARVLGAGHVLLQANASDADAASHIGGYHFCEATDKGCLTYYKASPGPELAVSVSTPGIYYYQLPCTHPCALLRCSLLARQP